MELEVNAKDIIETRDRLTSIQNRMDQISILTHSCQSMEDRVKDTHEVLLESAPDVDIEGAFNEVECEIEDTLKMAISELTRLANDYRIEI